MYCDCTTSANRTRWVVYGVFKAIALILLVAWINVKAELRTSFQDCLQSQGCWNDGNTWYCFHKDKVVSYCEDKNSNGFVAHEVLLVAWILCLIASSVPLCVMAATKKPPMQPTYRAVSMETEDQVPLRANPPHV